MPTYTELFLGTLGSAPILRKDLRLEAKIVFAPDRRLGKGGALMKTAWIDSTPTDYPPSRLCWIAEKPRQRTANGSLK